MSEIEVDSLTEINGRYQVRLSEIEEKCGILSQNRLHSDAMAIDFLLLYGTEESVEKLYIRHMNQHTGLPKEEVQRANRVIFAALHNRTRVLEILNEPNLNLLTEARERNLPVCCRELLNRGYPPENGYEVLPPEVGASSPSTEAIEHDPFSSSELCSREAQVIAKLTGKLTHVRFLVQGVLGFGHENTLIDVLGNLVKLFPDTLQSAEFICDNATSNNRLSMLVPGFRANLNQRQTLWWCGVKCTFIPKSQAENLSQVFLGCSNDAWEPDSEETFHTINCRYYLTLHPYQHHDPCNRLIYKTTDGQLQIIDLQVPPDIDFFRPPPLNPATDAAEALLNSFQETDAAKKTIMLLVIQGNCETGGTIWIYLWDPCYELF